MSIIESLLSGYMTLMIRVFTISSEPIVWTGDCDGGNRDNRSDGARGPGAHTQRKKARHPDPEPHKHVTGRDTGTILRLNTRLRE